MPIKGSLGALKEFTQGYIAPFPPVSVTAVPANPGIGGTITVTPNTYLGAPETYVATSNAGNFTGSSTSTTVEVLDMKPFANYYFDVKATSAGGNSNSVSTNSIFVGCNVVANGNVTFSGTPQQMIIDPDDTQVHLIAGNVWRRYSRNTTTGQLTLVSLSQPANASTLQSISIPDANSNRVYISGSVLNNNFPFGTFDTSTIWYYEKANGSYSLNQTVVVSGTNNYAIPSNWLVGLYGQATENLILLSRWSDNPPITGYKFYALNFTANSDTGAITWTGFPKTNLETIKTYQLVGRQITDTTPDNKYGYLILQQSGSGDKDLIAFPSVTTYNLSANVLTTYTDVTTSDDGNNIYAFDNDSINVFSKTANSSTLTAISNVSGTDFTMGVTKGADSVMFTGGQQLYDRDNTGNLSFRSGSNSFSIPANTVNQISVSKDSKNIYILNGNNISIFNIVS